MTRVLKPLDLQALYIILCIKVALVTDTGCGKGGKLTAMVIENGLYTLHSTPES